MGSSPSLAASAEYLNWLEDWMKFTEFSFSDIAYKAWPIPGKANYSGRFDSSNGSLNFYKGLVA